MIKKSLRLVAALLSMMMVFQTMPINALLANSDSDAATIQSDFFDYQMSDGDSNGTLQPADGMLEGIDFSSKRLLVGTDDPSIFTEDTQVLSEYDGIYLLAFADEAETMNAYINYYGVADFVESDSAVFIADDEYTDTAEADFPDSASDAFTQLNMLPDADGTHYDVAIIDTGAANGVTDSVSVIGGDGVDDNGHGTAMFSAVKGISDDISVLSIKAFDSRGVGKISAIYAAVAYAVKQGVDVINLSFDAESKADSVVLNRAVSMAQDAGITVVGVGDNNDADVTDNLSEAGDEDDVVVGSTSEEAAGISALIAAYGLDYAYNEISNGIIFDNDYALSENESLVDDGYFPDYEAHDQLSESDATNHPLLELSEL